MPIKLAFPLTKEFHLVKSDEALANTDGATMITIRQATQGDFERVSDLTAEFKREYDSKAGLVRAIQRISFDDIRRKQVFLTLIGSNIQDENGQPLFRFKNGRLDSEAQFKDAWDRLPPVIANEIHDCVLVMNEDWDDRVDKPKPAPVPTKEGVGEAELQRD